MISNGNKTFSADVELNLHVASQRYELGHLGPGFALLGQSSDIDASEGELETIIDGKSSRWKIRFTSSITKASKRFTFEAVDWS